MSRFLLIVCTLLVSFPLGAQYAPANVTWNQPIPPFRIADNLYYVGAAGVSSFLITTPKGDIVIDSGFRETAPEVEANIRTLGFRVEDVRILLNTHGHFDHAGGLAELKAATHAQLLVNPAEAPLLERGGEDDFAFGDRYSYPPVTPDGRLVDRGQVRLGGVTLTPYFTPGHTKGCTAWAMTVKQNGKPLHVVIACSLSAPDYQVVNNPKYPQILTDFARSFATVRALPCDIFLSPHGWDFDLATKAQAVASGHPDAFVDPEALRRYVDKSKAALDAQAAAQKAQQGASATPAH